MPVCDFRRDALGVLDRFNEATTPEGLVGEMAAALSQLGAEFFCFNFLPRPDEKFEDVMLAHRIPASWLELYLQRDFAAVDPAIRYCRTTAQPFDYTDAPCNPETEPLAAEVMMRAADFSLARGFLVPIAGPAGCEGNVWIGGYHLDLPEHEKPVAHLLALYAFERARRLGGDCRLKTRSITAREREVLTWIAAGKTAWEIGEILHISKRTVDEHTQTAARKLGAVNRTQAVAAAIRDRLIEL